MEKLSTQTKIRVLEERIEQINEHLEATDERVETHQEILINKGKGIVFRVGKLEHNDVSNDDRYAKFVSTLAVILSALAVILQVLDRIK